MKNRNPTYDWMLVTVRGYNSNKGYIYGNRHPDGKGVIIAKKHSVSRDWVKAMSSEKERTYTPPQSVIAVFSAEEKDKTSGFTIAGWAMPISKDLGQEDLFVTPVKVSATPRNIKNATAGAKQSYIDAVVLDASAEEVRTLEHLRSSALDVLNAKAKTSLGLDGARGFMIRIGHTAPDGSLEASGWEFFGRTSNTPEQTWNFHWNQKPQPGRQHNLLQAVLTASKSAFNNVGSYVEIVGCTRTLVNDFGSQKRVEELAALPNYKTTARNKVFASYSLAAITVEKLGKQRVIKQQFPLPRNKVINHLAGVLGNHVPGIRMPVAIAPMKAAQIEQVPADSAKPVSAPINGAFPLHIVDYVNGHGEVKSFRVKGTKQAVDKYQQQIERAAPGVAPFRVKGEVAYSFPLRFRREVESALSDLAGSPPLYISDIRVKSDSFITVSGKVDDPRYADGVKQLFTQFGASQVGGQFLLDETKRSELVAGLDALTKINKQSPTLSVDRAQPRPADQKSESAPKLRTRPTKESNRNARPTTPSFSDWLQSRFGKDPYAMLDYLDGEVSAFAEEAGIDWGSAKAAVAFGPPNRKGQLVKTRDIRPLDQGHRGSVAMAAHVREKHGTNPGHSIVWFKINFFNKKLLKDEVVTYDSFPSLKSGYDSEVKNGIAPSENSAELDAIRKRSQERQQEARQRIAQQAEGDQKSRTYWARQIPTLPKEDGTNQYVINKGIVDLVGQIDARRGSDKNGIFTIVSLHDIDRKFMGAQRLYENYWEDDKGKRTNKNFIRGTLFIDDDTGLSYGTHRLVGHVDPAKPVVFCEGVADAGTDRKATVLPTVICLNKGNLYHVVGAYRQRYPNTRLIIASDNDFYDIKKGNVGFSAALDAARDHKAEYVFPSFKGLDTSSKPTDFNDLEKIAGLDVVRSQIANVRIAPADALEFHKLKIQVIGLNGLEKHIDSAVTEIIERGSHGIDEARIYRALVNRAFQTYGREDVIATLGDKALAGQTEPREDVKIVTQKEIPFPVEIRENQGPSGKKYSLIIDHKGDSAAKIDKALKTVLGQKHLPFNEHLNGWIAPYPVMRLLNCVLYDVTGASQLYIGQSRAKATGRSFVVRGDFSDSDFKSKIEKAINYAFPEYKQSEYGFVIPDARAVPYVKETLRSYLESNRDLDVALPRTTVDVPQINQTLLDEAVALSGQTKGDVVLAQYALLSKDSKNIFLDTDFAFAGIYSRSAKSFSHLEPDVKHNKALEDACRNARAMFENGTDVNAVSEATLQRLGELVTHLEFVLSHSEKEDHSIEALSSHERNALDHTAEKIGVDSETANDIVQGLPSVPGNQQRDVILSEYQTRLASEMQGAQNEATLDAPETPTIEIARNTENYIQADTIPSEQDADTGHASHIDQEQLDRVQKLLEIVHLVVDKGFDEEEMYDIFITQPGSPYHNETTDAFNDVLYRQDMRLLSTSVDIPGWNSTHVSTTSQLYYAVYNDVARHRLGELENYISSYFGQNGVTTYKTFNKYFTGQQTLASDVTHPYSMEGEINHDVISLDLEHHSDVDTIQEYYRRIASDFESSQVEQDAGQSDIFSDNDLKNAPNAIAGDIICETAENGLKARVSEYSIGSQSVYELIVEIDKEGRWERGYHGFNLKKEIALAHLEHFQAGYQPGSELALASLPEATKGSVSTSTIDSISGNGTIIEHREVDTGPTAFYFLIERNENAGVETTVDHGVFVNYHNSTKAFQDLYRDRSELLSETEELHESTPIPAQEPVKPATADLGERFREWAKKGEPFDSIREILTSTYHMVFTEDSLLATKNQYLKLVDKITNDTQIKKASPAEKYDALYELTVNLAANELSYDEYIEELFKSEGQYVDRNPYWNAEKEQLDRRAAFDDIKAAGYQTLAQFYDGIFRAINKRSSTDLLIRRIGGYIPSSFDSVQPFRPQFSNLERLFQNDGIAGASPNSIPPFGDWVESDAAYSLLHPILAEDLASISSDDLAEKYGKDALLMLADIHGIALSSEMPSEELSRRISSQWKTRTQLSSMSSDELHDLDEGEVTDFLNEMWLPDSGKHGEKFNRLLGHIEQLRSISKLRIAQYSYINAALQMENSGKAIPNYVHRGITEFVSNETTFKDAADRAIEQVSTAQLRNNVDIAARLLTAIPALERAVLNASDPSSMKVVGIDQNKKSALAFSENLDKTKANVNRYRFKYVLPDKVDASSAALPDHLTHYGIYSDNTIGTASPIDTHFLLSRNYRPLSVDALMAVAAPLERWMEKYGYAGFVDGDGKTLAAVNEGGAWTLSKINKNSIDLIGEYSTSGQLLQKMTESIQGFSDRDILVEEWLKTCGTTYQQSIEALQNVIDGNAVKRGDDHLAETLTQEPFYDYVADHLDEPLPVQVDLVARELLNRIRQEAWRKIAPGQTAVSSVLADTESFISIVTTEPIMPIGSIQSPAVVVPLHSLTPIEALSLYEQYVSSARSQHKELFDPLEKKYFDTLSQAEKHALAVDIAAGTYENTGHFLHECDLKNALLREETGASEIAEKYYDELAIDTTEASDQSSNEQLAAGDYALVVYPDETYQFGKVVSHDGDRILCHQATHAATEDRADNPRLYAADGTYLPGLSLREFIKHAEAQVAPASYLDIDPRSEDGKSTLLRLSLTEISDYALVIGANHKGDRVRIMNSIDDFIFTKSKIIASNSDSEEAFLADDLARMKNVLGDIVKKRPLKQALNQWVADKTAHTLHELAKRNMALLQAQVAEARQGLASLNVNINSSFEFDASDVFVQRIHGVIDARSLLDDVKSIKDLAGWLTSGSDDQRVAGYSCLDQLSITRAKLAEEIAKIPPGIDVVPHIKQHQIKWTVADGESQSNEAYHTLSEAINAAQSFEKKSVAPFQDGDLVAWIESGKLRLAHAAGGLTDTSGKLSAAFTDKNGHSFIVELDSNTFIVLDEEQLEAEFRARLSIFQGDIGKLVRFFEDNVPSTEDELPLEATVKLHYLKNLAKQHAIELSKHEELLPRGYVIEQQGSEYAVKATGTGDAVPLNLNDTFETPSELTQHINVRYRNDVDQEEPHGAIANSANPTEQLGPNSQEPHGEHASEPQQQPQEEQQLVADVVDIAGKNGGSDGGDDDSPDDPTSGPGNGRLRNTRSVSPTNSTSSRRNSPRTSSPRTRGVGFHLADTLESEVSGGPEKRLQLNLDALQIRKELLETKREVTDEDRSVLSRYTGWGGIPDMFEQHYGYHKERSDLCKHLQDGEFDELKKSVLTAFYTPPTIARAMWGAIEHFGFRGGSVLDPGTGIGQYLGTAPRTIAQKTSFVAKEIEPVSASIAQFIYGSKRIHNEPYEKAKLPNDYFDVAISNIPFGDIRVFDSEYKKHNFRIHDYFFAKSLDKVKPGGVVAFITTTGTMDRKDPAVRQHLYKQADLLGAIRLPRKTFKEYAGTGVSADIVFLQKRLPDHEPKDDNWLWTIEHSFRTLADQEEHKDLPINRYFLDKPEMVIGENIATIGRYGPELMTAYSGQQSISEEIQDRITLLPSETMNLAEKTTPSDDSGLRITDTPLIADSNFLKPGSYVINNGQIGVVEPVFIEDSGNYQSRVLPVKIPRNGGPRVAGMIALRDTTKRIINLQLDDYKPQDLSYLQSELNAQYDRFMQKHGFLNDNANSRLFAPDPDSSLLLALEKKNSTREAFDKTDIFTKATIRSHLLPDHAETASDALNISLGVKGSVDPLYISTLLSKDWEIAVGDLGDAIYLDPKTHHWQPKEQYLSGNIREKLEYARDAAQIDTQFDRNINGLETVLPDPIPAYDIKVRLGATWIPVHIVGQFVASIITGQNISHKAQSNFAVSQHAATWVVKVDPLELAANEGLVTQEWGTKRLGAHELIDRLLNNRQVTVKDRMDDGVYIINRDETIAANQKADAISQEFRHWIWSDPERTKELEKLYNASYNVYAEPKYSGDSVQLVGISPVLKGKPLIPRDSQYAAVQRYLCEGRVLNAHPVGSGKTLELVASAMEGRRLGVHKKALIVVPNNILSQFGRMALELYPGASVLAINPKQLTKDARKVFTARIATSNWDMVVIAQSSFDKIATPAEHQQAVIDVERYQLREALQELSSVDNRAAHRTVKRLEGALKKLETKIEELSDQDKKDNFLYLNELGIDALFVDEADNYLNLHTPTQMGHVPGVNTTASQRAMNMFMAVRYIQALNGNNRGVIFATGTDIRNSMSDMYTMLRYLGPDVLEASGATNFDSFMGTFGEVVKTVEINPEGTGYRENSRLSKFTNIPEMVMMYRQVADVLTDKDLQIPRPKVDVVNVAAESGEWLRMYMAYLASRAKATRSGSVDSTDDNLLKIASDGRKASLDMRLVDPQIPEDPRSKVNLCAKYVLREWENGRENKLTQIVFCDLGVPKKGVFNIYDDIKEKLTAAGVPTSEIAFAQNFKEDRKKKELENALNNGDIRIVVASTETLGVGSNVQEKLIAEHNLDAPWRPRDLEQRGGRMERPGNSNALTRRYNYATADSFDLFMWETLKRKAAFIQQAKVDPRSAAREIDEDLNPTYSELMAITTGNPLIRRKIEIDSNLERMLSAERSHARAQWDGKNQIRSHSAYIDSRNDSIVSCKNILTALEKNSSELTIGGTIFNDTKKAAKAVNELLKQRTKNNAYKSVRTIPLGTIGALAIQLSYKEVAGKWVMQTDGEKPKIISEHKAAHRMVQDLIHFADEIRSDIRWAKKDIDTHERAIVSLQESATKPFKQKEELAQLQIEQRDLNIELSNMANDEVADQHNQVKDFEKERESLSGHAVRMRVG